MALLTVTQGMTTPSRPGKAPRPVWTVTGADVAAYADVLYRLGGRPWPRGSRSSFSFFDDPTEAIAQLGESDRLTFVERQEAAQDRAADRAERMSDSAQRHAAESSRRFDALHHELSARNGQPRLAGHYSARAWDAGQKRIENNMRAGVAEQETAEYLTHRAHVAARKASGEFTPRYVDNRIRETEAQLRDVQRKLQRYPSEAERWNILIAEYEERLVYWRSQMDSLGGEQYSRANVKPGDAVKVRGRWGTVAKSNPTTVAVNDGIMPWPLKWPYAEIQEHRPAGNTPPVESRLFIGIRATGISYADRSREVAGDYAPLAFLPYSTLVLDVRPDCPADLRAEIERDAAEIQGRRGQEFEASASGQTITLGYEG